MATRTQLRRGTTTDNNNFKGYIGELTMDTTTKSLRIHDGSRTGGYKVPTVLSEYKSGTNWYRKYSDGFIEAGFQYQWNGAWVTYTLPIAMPNADYTIVGSGWRTDGSPYQGFVCFRNYTSTTVDIWGSDDSSSNAFSARVYICGRPNYSNY